VTGGDPYEFTSRQSSPTLQGMPLAHPGVASDIDPTQLTGASASPPPVTLTLHLLLQIQQLLFLTWARTHAY
jgi:hypothetical protein